MRKRTVKILKGIAIAVVVLVVLYAVAVVVSSAKLRRAYANLEKAGRPMKWANVIPAVVPDAENAALLYESAILLLKAQPAEQENLLKHLGGLSGTFLTESLDADKRAELEQLLEQDVVHSTSLIAAPSRAATMQACAHAMISMRLASEIASSAATTWTCGAQTHTSLTPCCNSRTT